MEETEQKHDQETESGDKTPKRGLVDGKTELWVWAAIVTGALTLISWLIVFLTLGKISVLFHAAIVPTIGVLTIPIMAWGLITTLLRPPALQKPRVFGFALLMGIAYISNVPLFAPPLSTTDWASPEAQLPLRGEIYTIAGGDDLAHNYHGTTAAYRWGYDFTLRRDGEKFQLDGKKNEDYACFGSDVYAPLGGRVIDAVADIPDNSLGEIVADPAKTFGNHVLIEHAPDAFIWVAHMKLNSVTPKIGDTVSKGDVIGACGNSGRSVEPHVHVHAQSTGGFPYAESLPLKFRYTRDGESVTSMPRGETGWNAGNGDVITVP